MSEIIRSEQVHTRLKFSPLTTSCELVCLTLDSPTVQSINALLPQVEWEPDRTVSPTVILPDVRALDRDKIFPRGSANSYLSLDGMQWTVDDTPIADKWQAAIFDNQGDYVSGDYSIDTSQSDTRGTLTIYRNFAAGEHATLRFSGRLLDWRTNIAYTFESNEKELSCSEKGSDAIVVSVDRPSVEYDPVYDRLLLYDYKVARGIPVSGTRSDYSDRRSYEQSLTITLVHGTTHRTSLPAGWSMRLVRPGAPSQALVPGSAASPEVIAVNFPTVTFDMRQIANAEYVVQILRNGTKAGECNIGLHTKLSAPLRARPMFGADISPAVTEYKNHAMVNLPDRMIEYPVAYYLLKWFTRAQHLDNGAWVLSEEKARQWGEDMEVETESIGMGWTFDNSCFAQYFKVFEHSTRELLTDESDNVLTDEDGEMLIG